MAVRIVFRGLILFAFPREGRPNANKLVAYLLNDNDLTGGLEVAKNPPKKEHGKHEHHHSGEIQIVDDGLGKYDPKPVMLDRGMDVDIVIPGDKGVTTARSFNDFVPNLEDVVAGATGALKGIRRADPPLPKSRLIQNQITVDRGVVHVKNVINWDEEGYPLRGREAPNGQRPGAPVLVNFMGSTVKGHVASEVIVEIADANEVELVTKQEKLHGKRKGSDRPNHRVPPDTVEVLVTNFEFRRDKPVAWGLDYQWLFEAAGYDAVDLAGPQFDEWIAFASNYDAAALDSERRQLLTGDNFTRGRPFPYIRSADALSSLTPLTDQYNPPVCLFGTTLRPFP